MTTSTTTLPQFPSPSNTALPVDSLFQAAFNLPRDPRSTEYEAGVRAAPKTSPGAGTGKLIWLGTWFSESDDPDECLFNIQENDTQDYWTAAQILARIDEFSEQARARIMACCQHHEAGPLYDVINERGEMLMTGVTHTEATSAIDAHQAGDDVEPQWQGDMCIRLRP